MRLKTKAVRLLVMSTIVTVLTLIGPMSLATVNHDTQSKKDEAGDWDASGGNISIPKATQDMILAKRVIVHKALRSFFYTFEHIFTNGFNGEFTNPDSDVWKNDTYKGGLFELEIEKIDKYRPYFKGVNHKLFSKKDGRKNIYDVLDSDNTKIELEFIENCTDENGEEKDGSTGEVIGDGVICLSNKRLKEKLDYPNVESVLASLVVHEYMHEMGGTEEEAKAVEFLAMFYANKVNLTDFVDARPLQSSRYNISTIINEILQGLDDSKSYTEFSDDNKPFDKIMSLEMEADKLIGELGAPVDERDDNYTEKFVKLQAIRQYLTGVYAPGNVTLKDKNNLCFLVERYTSEFHHFNERTVNGKSLLPFSLKTFGEFIALSINSGQSEAFCKDYGSPADIEYGMFTEGNKRQPGNFVFNKEEMIESSNVESRPLLNRVLPYDFSLIFVTGGNGDLLRRSIALQQKYFNSIERNLQNDAKRMEKIEGKY